MTWQDRVIENFPKKETLTQKIFQQECPVHNSYQGSAKRLLFVCSIGMLRSPTAQVVATRMGYNARACGSDQKMALIPISSNLIEWADHIFFLNFENLCEALNTFEGTGYDEDIRKKKILLNVEDNFEYMNPHLCWIIEGKLQDLQKVLTI
jgi:predicted protein tyrosine phosphatase